VKIVSLKSIQAELESGSRPRSGVTESQEVPSIGGEQINADGSLRKEKLRFITFESFENIRSGKVSKGDILIVKDGATTGKTAFYNGELAFSKVALNEHVFRLKVDNFKADSKFVYWFLRSGLGQREILKDFRGATVGGISKGFTQKAKIPLPPLEEQQRIAGILDAADILRAKRREALARLDDLLQSTFLDMFGDPVTNPKGWETKTLPEIISSGKHSLKRGPFGGALKKEIFVDSGYLVYEQNHALNNDYSFGRYFITEEKFKELIAFKVEPNDILISCSGVYLGKLSIVPQRAKPGIINQALLKVTLDQEKMKSVFFTHVFGSSQFKNRHFPSNRGLAIPNLPPMNVMKKIAFISPPLDLQQRFAEIVSTVEKQKAKMRMHLEQLDDLFASLQQRAFRGDL
jgi:type I restriction enzyme S subunit